MSSTEKLKEMLQMIAEEKRKSSGDTIVNVPEVTTQDDLVERALGLIGGNTSTKTKDPLTPLDQNFVTHDQMQTHYKEFVARVQQQMSTIGGGGEVKFRYLDDVNRATMLADNDNWILEYDTATGKVQFTNQIGPIDLIRFDRNHAHEETLVPGTLCWSEEDETLNLQHPNGVTQQVGQETYAYVRNRTGADIPDGTAVQFVGAEQNGTSRLLIAPMLADGNYPSLYVLGVATETIRDGEDGKVTVWGKVRDIDTSAWEVGDLIYVSPTVAGGLTNVKPTAPDNCIPVAAVLRKDSEFGEIFVRPTIEQQMSYGTVSDSTDQSPENPNEATVFAINTTENVNGVNIDPVDTSKIVVSQSGLYAINVNIQLLSTNSSAKSVWVWLRKNGTDIPYSSRVISIVGNSVYRVFNVTHNVSLDANDYIQVVWAANDATVTAKAVPATTFAPAAPSIHVHIDQGAL